MYVSTYQLKNTIGHQMTPYWSSGRNYAGFSDSQYYLLNYQSMQGYLQSHPIAGAPQLGEGFDCDDYSFILKGQIAIDNRDLYGFDASLGVGIAWARFEWIDEFHAANWFVDPAGIFYWIEPQNGQIYPLEKCLPHTLNLLII